LNRPSRSDQTGDHSISADRSKGAGIGIDGSASIVCA
jgi:hypothetical protein